MADLVARALDFFDQLQGALPRLPTVANHAGFKGPDFVFLLAGALHRDRLMKWQILPEKDAFGCLVHELLQRPIHFSTARSTGFVGDFTFNFRAGLVPDVHRLVARRKKGEQ